MNNCNTKWGKLYDKGWRTAMREDRHFSHDELLPQLQNLLDAGYQAQIVTWSPIPGAIKEGFVIMAEGRYSKRFRDPKTGRWLN